MLHTNVWGFSQGERKHTGRVGEDASVHIAQRPVTNVPSQTTRNLALFAKTRTHGPTITFLLSRCPIWVR